MSYRILVSARAKADALESFRWYTERSPAAAARWYAGLEKAIAKLGEDPKLHTVAEEESAIVGITLREMLYGRRRGVFRLLYSIEGEIVVLHYVRHTARGPLEP